MRPLPRLSSNSLRLQLIHNSSHLLNHNNLHHTPSLSQVASLADLLVSSQAQRRLLSSRRSLNRRNRRNLSDSSSSVVLLEDATWRRGGGGGDGRPSRVRKGGDNNSRSVRDRSSALDDVSRARGELNATREAGDRSNKVLSREDSGEETGGLLNLAGLALSFSLDSEERAVLDAARVVCASVHSGLEESLFPSHDEIAVVSVTSWVTVREDELTIHAVELSGVPDSLVEEARETDGEVRGARAVHDGAGVCDVIHLVLGSNVLAVPARGEHQLGADAVLAVGVEVGLVGHEMAVEGALGREAVVEAVEADGLLGEALLGGRGGLASGEVALVGVAGDHLHAVGEGGDLGLAGGVVEEVVAGVVG
jgi:hypothetical protein